MLGLLCRMTPASTNPILLYDGVCGLCNRLIQFVLTRDRNDRFRFASQQSPFAAHILRRHGVEPGDLDTIYLVLDFELPGERLLARSDAVLCVLRDLGGVWRWAAALSRSLPMRLRNWLYNLVARRRYALFGKLDSCPLPEAKHIRKVLDAEESTAQRIAVAPKTTSADE